MIVPNTQNTAPGILTSQKIRADPGGVVLWSIKLDLASLFTRRPSDLQNSSTFLSKPFHGWHTAHQYPFANNNTKLTGPSDQQHINVDIQVNLVTYCQMFKPDETL
jgi:hypothetical protein